MPNSGSRLELPQRRSVRRRGFDYASAAVYFVTICTAKRACVLGDIVEGRFRPSELGTLVEHVWNAIPDHTTGVELDAHVVMPNHIHCLLRISEDTGTRSAVGPDPAPPLILGKRHAGPSPRSLGAIIGSFKAAVSRRANMERKGTVLHGQPVWQRGYHEHIVRDSQSLQRIRSYIGDNPVNWASDMNHPAFVTKLRGGG